MCINFCLRIFLNETFAGHKGDNCGYCSDGTPGEKGESGPPGRFGKY